MRKLLLSVLQGLRKFAWEPFQTRRGTIGAKGTGEDHGKPNKYGAAAQRVLNAKEHTPKESPPAVVPKPAPAPKAPSVSLAEKLEQHFRSGAVLPAKSLWDLANNEYGGTRAEGRYGPSDAYDAMETGLNLSLRGQTDPTADLTTAGAHAEKLASIVSRLPTQTNRSGNKDAFQQFSTPPHYAFAAAWLANLGPNDIVLEPTGGTGSLAIHAVNSGATVYGNELDPNRASLLRSMLGADKVYGENAEQISAILPKRGMPRPTAIVMNPPFSQTAGRMGDRKDLLTAAKHIDEALSLLQPGGRLVAIVGRGMDESRPTYRPWFEKLSKAYNLRANVGVSGEEYKKYGTHFGTRILVIDKTGPQKSPAVKGEVATVSDLMSFLEGVRNDRPQVSGQSPGQPVGPATPPAVGSGSGVDAAGQSSRVARPGAKKPQARTPNAGARNLDPAQSPGNGGQAIGGGLGDGRTVQDVAATGGATGQLAKRNGSRSQPVGRGGVAPGQPSEQSGNPRAGFRAPEPIRIAKVSANPENEPGFTGYDRLGRKWVDGKLVKKDEFETGDSIPKGAIENDATLYAQYRPALLHIEGAKPHNTPLVESVAMASVLPPIPTYAPTLSPDIIDKGLLSEAQLESVVYAGQAHGKTLASGQRRGYFIGDGTGVGKGREIAGIIMDNFNQGRTKALWLSQKQNLYEDAVRDWTALGGDPSQVITFDTWKKMAIKPENAIVFITYDTLKSMPKDKAKESNLDQITGWLGAGFDGAIAFDEAHSMANAMDTEGGMGVKKASRKALSGLDLQKKLPNARVTYVSATGATEVSNLAYAERLGLWGPGTEFADRDDFVNSMTAGGVAAMEAVAQSMKATGSYMARSLSFDGVTYNKLTHNLTDEQKFIYDTLSDAWQKVMGNIDVAIGLTGASGRERAVAMGQFWNAQQRFFNQIITAMQTPSVISAIQQDLDAGRAPVVQLVNTMESALKRAVQKSSEGEAEVDPEDIDVSPRDILVQYLEKSFPVTRMEEYEDENGQVRTRVVRQAPDVPFDDFVRSKGSDPSTLDEATRNRLQTDWQNSGAPVTDPRAEAIRDEMIGMTRDALRIPQSPIDQIINHFGHENVAEATGRTVRRILKDQEDGKRRMEIETRDSRAASAADAAAFQDGRKKILIFSDAGGTGRSYHADKRAKNQAQRVHYLLQPGWRADNAVQGLGRTHRTNQAQPPVYRLVQINELKGQKRFISTIARRLDQLGALTKGQRQAGGGGMFTATDNLESKESKQALGQFMSDLQTGDVPGLDYTDVMGKMGYLSQEEQTKGKRKDINTDMNQFLNRVLILKPELQGKVFEAFEKRMNDQIGQAIAKGTLDSGVENFKAVKIRKIKDEPVYQDADSGAEARILTTTVTRKVEKRPWQENTQGDLPLGFVRNTTSGQVWAVHKANDETNERGNVIPQYRLIGPANNPQWRPQHEFDRYSGRYEKLDEATAKAAWDAEYAELPDTEDGEAHFVTGAFLPIWKRIPGADKPKVFRVKLDDGSSTVGRQIQRNKIEEFMKNVGKTYEQQAQSNDDLHAGLASKKVANVSLSNGWKLRPVRVQNEPRIEIVGVNPYYWDQLKNAGVIHERIGYQNRWFIPTGEAGRAVMAKVMQGHSVTDVERNSITSFSDRGSKIGMVLSMARQAVASVERNLHLFSDVCHTFGWEAFTTRVGTTGARGTGEDQGKPNKYGEAAARVLRSAGKSEPSKPAPASDKKTRASNPKVSNPKANSKASNPKVSRSRKPKIEERFRPVPGIEDPFALPIDFGIDPNAVEDPFTLPGEKPRTAKTKMAPPWPKEKIGKAVTKIPAKPQIVEAAAKAMAKSEEASPPLDEPQATAADVVTKETESKISDLVDQTMGLVGAPAKWAAKNSLRLVGSVALLGAGFLTNAVGAIAGAAGDAISTRAGDYLHGPFRKMAFRLYKSAWDTAKDLGKFSDVSDAGEDEGDKGQALPMPVIQQLAAEALEAMAGALHRPEGEDDADDTDDNDDIHEFAWEAFTTRVGTTGARGTGDDHGKPNKYGEAARKVLNAKDRPPSAAKVKTPRTPAAVKGDPHGLARKQLEKVHKMLSVAGDNPAVANAMRKIQEALAELKTSPPVEPSAKPKRMARNGQPEGKIKNAILDAYEELLLFKEFRGGLVEIPRLYHEAAKRMPGLTVPEFHKEIENLSDDRSIELHKLNEVDRAKDPHLAINKNNRMYYYAIWDKKNRDKAKEESTKTKLASARRAPAPKAPALETPKGIGVTLPQGENHAKMIPTQ